MTGVPLAPTDPTTIGGYRLVSRLGAGGMGTVYLAQDRTGATVAVKVLHEHLASDPQFLARFAAEATAARRVAGFCTARVVHAEVRPPRPFLVAEYVEGPTLQQVLTLRGRLPGSEVEALAVGVAAALTAIHAAGVVHRDLKPSNVILSGFGPKVIDFGVARALADTSLTGTGLVFGTLGWMAPEQLRGAAVPASDVYVWGLMVAHAGAGWGPDAQHGGPPTPAQLAALPPDLARHVSAALHPDPAKRPGARELLLRLCGSAEPGPVRTATSVLSRPWDPRYSAVVPQPYARPQPARSQPSARQHWPPHSGHPNSARLPVPVHRGTPGPLVPQRLPAPQPPVPRAPLPRRKPWYRRKRVVVPAIVLGLVLWNNAGDQPPAELPPRTARDGILEFAVTSIECGQDSLGESDERQARGQLCEVELHVRNFGSDTRKVHVGSQKLFDDSGRSFKADDGAWRYLPESTPFFTEDINPGNEITATLVYDIAEDAEPARLEVHDSPFSGGATITL